MDKILALYDSDVFYATRFMEYFVRKNDTGFEISVFTRKDSLEEFLSSNNIDILLSGSEVMLEEQVLKKIKYTYYLTDISSGITEDKGTKVNKYQAVSSMMEEIISDYERKENLTRDDLNLDKMKITAVFPPISGIEKVTFAWSLSSLLADQRKTLLIMMDLLPVPVISSMDQGSQCLSDFIYYLKENQGVDKMQILTRSCGKLSVLSGILHGADILSLTKEDIQRWCEGLRTSSGYERIIFYLGCYSEATIELMKQSDEVIITSSDQPYELDVLREWERQMNQSGVHAKQDKFRLIKLQTEELQMVLPLSIQDFMNSVAWTEAEQYLID